MTIYKIEIEISHGIYNGRRGEVITENYQTKIFLNEYEDAFKKIKEYLLSRSLLPTKEGYIEAKVLENERFMGTKLIRVSGKELAEREKENYFKKLEILSKRENGMEIEKDF